jgi:hypothetical protein
MRKGPIGCTADPGSFQTLSLQGPGSAAHHFHVALRPGHASRIEDVDGRIKSGHDEFGGVSF